LPAAARPAAAGHGLLEVVLPVGSRSTGRPVRMLLLPVVLELLAPAALPGALVVRYVLSVALILGVGPTAVTAALPRCDAALLLVPVA
jgi:hypothetical protein